MKALTVSKFGFRVRTRNGALVDNILIAGRDQGDAERKLMQMYPGCEILHARSLPAQPAVRAGSASFEDVMNMITAASH